MTAKVRVEDLAVELKLSNKEIIQQLREIGVQAKSQKTVVEDEDVDRLKAEMKKGGSGKREVRRVSDSGVIIRRRRNKSKAPKEEEAATPIEDTVEEVVETPVEEVAETPVKEEAAPVKEAKEPKAEKNLPKRRLPKRLPPGQGD